jgi:hypothetical protein
MPSMALNTFFFPLFGSVTTTDSLTLLFRIMPLTLKKEKRVGTMHFGRPYCY